MTVRLVLQVEVEVAAHHATVTMTRLAFIDQHPPMLGLDAAARTLVRLSALRFVGEW